MLKTFIKPVFFIFIVSSLAFHTQVFAGSRAKSDEYYSGSHRGSVQYRANSPRVERRVGINRSAYYPIRVKGRNYFYRDGQYYLRRSGRYLTIAPPLGARVGFLPRSAISFDIGPRRYFRVGLTWYLHREKDIYEVVENPRVSSEADQVTTYEQQQVDMVVYPAGGQSAEQQDRDRYECYRWAKEQSAYDPTLPNQDLSNKDVYARAMTACLESREYTVR